MFLKKLSVSCANGKKYLLCLTLASMTMLNSGFTMDNVHQVRIQVDGQTIETHTFNASPEHMLDVAGVHLGEQDEYYTKVENRKTEITVFRAQPITIEYQGTKKEVLTTKQNVGEALSNLGYNVNDYLVHPGLDAEIQEHQVIRLEDSDAVKAAKAEEVRQAELAQRQQEEASRGVPRYSEVLTMEATAYLPTEGSEEGLTATGIAATYGIVAVDPDVIPLGTRLFIPGYGEALAADTGGAIQGNKIDLCMESYNEMEQFGRRDITVYILQ